MEPADKLPEYVTEHDESALLAACRGPRERAVLKFLIHTGLRVSELVGLKTEEINTASQFITVVGKGGKERVIPLSDDAIVYLSEYLKRKPRATEYVFTSKGGASLTRQAIYAMVNNIGKRAGLEHIHPHIFRHTFCTRLVEKGVPLHKVGEIAGHTKLDTTRIYTRVTLNQKHEVVAKLNSTSGGFLRKLLYKFRLKTLRDSVPLARYSRTETGKVSDIRQPERQRLKANVRERIPTCIFAPEGYGKSMMLQEIKDGDRTVYIRCLETKNDVMSLLEALHEKAFFPDFKDFAEFKKETRGESIPDLLLRVNKNVAEDYVLVIDDITNVSRKFRRYFLQISGLFCIVTASEKKHEIILDKFDIIELPLLSRREVISLVNGLVDPALFQSEKVLLAAYDRIYSRSHGFPRGVVELADKIRRNHYNLASLTGDGYANPANTKSIGMLLMLVGFVMFAFVMKFSIQGFATTAIIYIGLIVGRMLLFKRR